MYNSNKTMVDELCFFHSWEVITLFVGSTISLLSSCLVLFLLWWLRLPRSCRLTIQLHRALTLVGYFSGYILALTSCPIWNALFVSSTALFVFSCLSHVIWTMVEGWHVYRALVRKEQIGNFSKHFSWLTTLCVYIPCFLVTLSPLILRASLFWPITLFYELFFAHKHFKGDFWQQILGKILIMTAMTLFATVAMLVFNIIIICLVFRSIRNRSKIFERMSDSSRVGPSPKSALVILTLSMVLSLNAFFVIFAFSPSALLALFGRLSIIFLGSFFLFQFIFCNKTVKLALKAKMKGKAQPNGERDLD